uniref:Protein kinase domain-containing protein n=1 Tax=Hymenolepis diminuta TaxID=6216 RepID=A0A0R3SL85_HYMDI
LMTTLPSSVDNRDKHVRALLRLRTPWVSEIWGIGLIFILGLRSPYHGVVRLKPLSLFNKKPDIKKSRHRPESATGPLTASVQLENDISSIDQEDPLSIG